MALQSQAQSQVCMAFAHRGVCSVVWMLPPNCIAECDVILICSIASNSTTSLCGGIYVAQQLISSAGNQLGRNRWRWRSV